MSVDWTELRRDEADRLAIEQEHRLLAAVPRARLRPGRGQVVRRSAAWFAVWVVTGHVQWQAMPS